MPIPNNKLFLNSAMISGDAVAFTPNAPGDFQPVDATIPVSAWVGATTDMNGDGRPDLIFGAPLDDDKATDAGRVFVELNAVAGGSTVGIGDSMTQIIIDGVNAGDHAGAAVGGIADLNGDGRGEILIGAPGMDNGALTDAGVAFVVYGKASGGVDLGDPYSGGGGGYAIKGQAAGDAAGTSIQAIADLNGDGKMDVIVGAPGNDQGGTDAGAAYVVWGKSGSSAVNLSSVAAGTGGFKITGDAAGDGAGQAIGVATDMNGDGKAEILVGAPGSAIGGADGGAVYVVFGKSTGAAVDLTNVAAGTGGFVIKGQPGDRAGASVTGIGDVNGDGLGDILVGAPGADHAYVVFGKADGAAVDLTDVAAGIGGFEIVGETPGSLNLLSVAGGKDLNHDGIADFVIGAQGDTEGGTDAGAVYVVWGGGSGTVDLSMVAQSMGGAKIVGDAGSLTGATVSIVNDMNGDGTADLMIGAPGAAESAYLVYTPSQWQPDTNVYGTSGADLITPGYGGAHVVGDGADNIVAAGGDDTIDAGGGNDTIDGGAGNDSMSGGQGDDTYYVDTAGDEAVEAAGEGNDTVIASADYVLGDNVEALVLDGYGLAGTGNGLDNTITGTAGNDTLDGGAGNDTLTGGAGNDTYVVDAAGDVVVEAAGDGNDTVIASVDYTLGDNVEALVLSGAGLAGTGNAGNNAITGTAGNDTLDGGAGTDTLTGGAGDDVYYVDNASDVIVESAGGGSDTVVASVNYTLGAGAEVEKLVLAGTAHSGTGNAFANTIVGTAGNDTLNGGAGADTLDGGGGNDTYYVDNAGDTVVEAAGGGTDTVVTSIDYSLTAGSAIENLTLTGTAHLAVGNSGDNLITGGSGNDTLDGGGGLDTLAGGAGNDTYVVHGTTDTLVEAAGGGTDTVLSSVDYTLTEGSNIENLTLSGTAHHGVGNSGDNLLTGGTGADSLEGGQGNDTIDGGAGADTMAGGDGNDTYYVDNPGDVVVETATGGTDTVVVNSDWTLADNIENVRLSGSGHVLTGNAGNNTLTGDTGSDTLNGGAGDDVEEGGDGNDVLVSTSGHDTLAGGAGNDVYKIHGGAAHIEDFQGNDTIDASEATGDSHIDLSGATTTEIEHQTCDFGTGGTVTGALNVQFLQDLTGSFADDIANVRILVPQIVTALQSVSGGAAFGVSSFRDKAYGAFGGAGDWVYQTDVAMGATPSAVTTAYAGFVASGGNDLPEAQLEALLQLSVRAGGEVGYQNNSARFVVLFTDASFHTAADGTAAGITTANNGNAIINDGGVWENYPEITQLRTAMEAANIIPIFAIAGGFETTYQSLVTQLGRGNVVTLSADSSNIVSAITSGLTTATTTHIAAAVGGAGNDVLIGNVGDNQLTGGAGNDTLTGGAGNDVIHGGDGSDTAVFAGPITDYTLTHNADGTLTVADHGASGDGTDTLDGVEVLQFGATLYTTDGVPVPTTVITAGADSLLVTSGVAASVDAAVLLGNDTASNGEALTVTAVSNVTGGTVSLAGGKLTVTASGSGGFDYTVTGADGVTTTGHATFDTVATDAGGNKLTLAAGYTATAVDGQGGNDTLTGAAGGDHLWGGAGNDVLDGGTGADTLYGGAGNDVFYVDNTGDVASEESTGAGINDGGSDRVMTSVSYTLGAFIENMNLMGTGDLDGTGNSINNSLNGNSGANHLWGMAGDDLLLGNAGNDSLYGGDGNDSLNGGADADLLHGDAGVDSLNGGDGHDVAYGDAGNDTLDGGAGADTMYGGAGNDIYYVDNIGDVVSEESAGAGINDGGGDRVMSTVDFTLGTFLENLNLLGGANLNGTGNSLNNGLNGNSGNNTFMGLGGNDTLNGSGGDDTLAGGQGNDVLNGGTGADTFVFAAAGAANGLDTVQDFVHGTDHLLFTGTDYGFAAGHLLAASEFTAGSSAAGASAQFVWDAAAHTLYWDHDGQGGDAAIAIATFDAGATVTAGDLIFV